MNVRSENLSYLGRLSYIFAPAIMQCFVSYLFQALDDSVACEEKALLDIEDMVESLRPNTSPAGVEQVVEEAEELRLGWQRLREGLCKADEGLRSSLDTHSQYMTRCQRLGDDIGRLRELFKGLDQELEETQDCRDRIDHTEEQMVGQWTKYTVGLLTISAVL